MTTEVIVGGDVVALIRAYMLEVGFAPWTGVKVLNRRPNPTTGRVVVIRRSGGTQGDLVTDAAFVTFECFAKTSADAMALAMRAYAICQSMKHQTVDGVQCYRVDTLAAPADHYDAEAQVERFTFSMQPHFRAAAI